MSYVQGSLGAMLQGVSQQPERIRVDGQVSEQINYESDVSEGLTSRPGTDEIATLAGSTNTMTIQKVSVKNTDYMVGHGTGELAMWTMSGTPLTVVTPDGTDYLGPDMVFHSEEDGSLLCLNRETTVLKDPTVVGRSFHAGLITCLGGQFSRTYTAKVTYQDGTTIEAEFTTPDGTAANDSDKTAGAYIIYQLQRILKNHPNLKAGTVISMSDNTVIPMHINSEPVADIEAETGEDFSTSIDGEFRWFDPESFVNFSTTLVSVKAGDVMSIEYTEPLSIVVDDGEYGTIIRSATDSVDDLTDLPRFAQHGHIVRVVGSVSEDDDYFLRFTSDVDGALDGDEFGKDGVWREWADPDQANSLDLTTMPHALSIDGTTATFEQASWESRRVGDDNSNPHPEFVGKIIRDLGGFESRLVMVAGSSMITSRSDKSLDLYKESASADSVSDPIGIKSRKAEGATLDWIVPFDRNLLLVSDPGEAQFVVTGGGLTPNNASMVLTTDYTVIGKTRPVTTGRTIMLPFVAGNFAGINEFFTNDQVATNGADPITAVQDRYITGTVDGMAVAENFNRVAFKTDADARTVWIYKYLWSGAERAQSAWFKQTFPADIRAMFYDSSNFYVVIDDPANAGTAILVRMDLNRADADVGFHVTLDRKVDLNVASNTVTVNYANARIVQRAGCETPGVGAQSLSIVDNGNGTFTHTLDDEICPNGATVTVGIPVPRLLQPTMPHYKDRNDRVVSSAVLTVLAFFIHLAGSSDVKITMDSPYRATREFYPRRFPLDDEALDPSREGYMDYTLRAPWGEQTSRANLTLSSDDIRPDTILEIEWEGQLRGNRRRI